MADELLVPARMVNEYVYSPRLFYLEWVQGEWADSADTVEGRFQHRRVDQPGGALPAAEDAEDRLDEEGRLDPALVDDPGKVVEMPEVVAFELEAIEARFLHAGGGIGIATIIERV